MTKLRAPKANPIRKGVRGLLETGLSLIPYAGGILIRMFRHFAPPKIERDTREWQSDITEQSNKHGDRLDAHEKAILSTTTLSLSASTVAKKLAQTNSDGLSHICEANDYLDAQSPTNEEEFQDAIHELAHHGLVTTLPAFSAPLRFRLTQRFFEQIDKQVMGWVTEDDAKTLAKLILADDSLSSAVRLHEKIEWSKRRFNPALQYLANECVDPGRVSREIQADYATAYLVLAPADRAAMRRFVS